MHAMSVAQMQGVQGGGGWADFLSGVVCGASAAGAAVLWLTPEPTGLTKVGATAATTVALAECGKLLVS